MLFRDAGSVRVSCQASARTSYGFRYCSRFAEGDDDPNHSDRPDDPQKLAILLKKSVADRNLHDGRLLYFLLAHHQLEESVLYGNRILSMYAKCEAPQDARAFFNRMCQKDTHSWRFLMNSFASDEKFCKQIFQQMMMEGVLPVKATFVSVLSACIDVNSLVHGIRIHASIEYTQFKADMEVENSILNMYGSCKKSTLAVDFYNGMLWCNVITFNTMIGAFLLLDNSNEALKLFDQLELQALTPSAVTFISMVSACTAAANLAKGKEMHARVLGSEFASDVVLMNNLLNMYGKCADLTDAQRVFWEMPRQDVATWNSLITSLKQHKRGNDAIQVFQHMQFMGPFPNNVTVLNTLGACDCGEALGNVKQLHLNVVRGTSDRDVILGTALVTAYAKCGDLESAVKVFVSMPSWYVILWNAMIKAYVNHGQNKEAVELFHVMQVTGLFPDVVTIVVVLDAFMELEEGKNIHEYISQHGFETDPVVRTGLINMYNRCCSLYDVLKVFDNMSEHDLVSWNAFLSAIVQHSSKKEVFCRLQMMMFEGVFPDGVTFNCLFDGCKNVKNSKEARWIHALFMASNSSKSTHSINCIINMYGSFGHFQYARQVFEETENRDEITWNVLIAAYSQGKQNMEAVSVFRQMQVEGLVQGTYTFINLLSGFTDAVGVLEGKRVHASIIGSLLDTDIGISNSLLSMYCKCGKQENGRRLFDASLIKDTVTWNAMLTAYAQWQDAEEASLVFQRMLVESTLPDRVTLTCMVSAWTKQAVVAEGKRIHVCILGNDFASSIPLVNALIIMYGKSGSLEDANQVFKNMQHCDVVSWSAIIAAYALHGRGEVALHLYNKMQENSLVPDNITNLFILCACSHSGLLKEGLECFISMIQDYGIKPQQQHLNTLIDLLGRAGLLDAAESLTSLQPSCSWITLLNLCRMHCDRDRGERVGKQALRMEPHSSALYVLLSNLCASQEE
ncbi:hypothetical protein L7F22_010114 [Adiantum nelumboides]|nr:hypothetical protein [Adiantum nelumboides]